MVTSLPPHIYSQKTPAAGTGLYTSKAIPPGELIFRVERPLVAALNSGQLGVTCEGCYLSLAEGAPEIRKNEMKKRVKMCGVSQSWKSHHKYECQIFQNLHPKVLPNTVRLVVQLLLRRRARSLSDDEWNAFLTLQSHIEDFQSQQSKNEDNLTTWQTIQLMSQAALSYSGSHESLQLVQAITARVLVNAHTLTTPTLDPLGVYISIPSSLLNHSCVPNAALTFSLHGILSVRSLLAIPASTALTICYNDITMPTDVRRAELRERYHFTCTCTSCSASNAPVLDNAGESLKLKLFDQSAKMTFDPPDEMLPILIETMLAFSPLQPPYEYPLPKVHQQIILAGICMGQLHLAITHALVMYFYVDPVLYPMNFHPVRVVHEWVLVQLLSALLAKGEKERQATGKMGGMCERYSDLNAPVVVSSLWQDVDQGVKRSHGSDSVFAAQVRQWGEQHGCATVASAITAKEREREWAKLRKLADESQKDATDGS
ncbi:hypothetical protein MMC07_007910 [Pseudocyphellaria aurata]|nr:hypothetical protein [Pseudocyphellaria aurata]